MGHTGPVVNPGERERAERRLEELVERARTRARRSLRTRVGRVRGKAWHVVQAAVAAGLAWFVARHLVGHPDPVFAPIVALICLGMSYAQRLRRVAEVTVGVAVGVLVADLFVAVAGYGTWQIALVTATAMTVALLLDAGQLLVIQSGVQSIFVVTLAPGPGQTFTRWIDAMIGGAVALLAAVVVPSAPLRQPRMQASEVAGTIARLLRGTAEAVRADDIELASAVLAQARMSERLVRELEDAAEEGMDAIASSPLLRPQRGDVHRVVVLIEPLDRALRGTRVLARRVVVAISTGEQVPPSYLSLLTDLATASEVLAQVLLDNVTLANARPPLLAAARATADLERTGQLSTEVVLAQVRSVVVDLLQVTGMGLDEAVAAVPPARST